MKASITPDGQLLVTAETMDEADHLADWIFGGARALLVADPLGNLMRAPVGDFQQEAHGREEGDPTH